MPRPEEKQTKKKVPTVLVNFPYCSENDLETQLQIYSDTWTFLVLRELQNADGGMRDTADDVAGCDWSFRLVCRGSRLSPLHPQVFVGRLTGEVCRNSSSTLY